MHAWRIISASFSPILVSASLMYALVLHTHFCSNIGKMFASAGDAQLICYFHVPKALPGALKEAGKGHLELKVRRRR